MAKSKTLIVELVDRSGSMQKHLRETIAGHNAYLAGLTAAEPDASYLLATFDSTRTAIEPLTTAKHGTRFDTHNYVPGAMTPLYDAVLAMISRADELRQANQPVIMVILTDGLENASRHSLTDVQREIEKRQGQGWLFVFMGANQDAWLTAQSIGIRRGAAQTFRQDKTVELFTALVTVTTSYMANPDMTADEAWDCVDATKFGGSNRMTY